MFSKTIVAWQILYVHLLRTFNEISWWNYFSKSFFYVIHAVVIVNDIQNLLLLTIKS